MNTSRDLLQSQVIKGEFVGTSGKALTNYLDCRPLVVDRRASAILSMDMINLACDYIPRPFYLNVGAICGAVFAGAHLACIMSHVNPVPGTDWFAYHGKKGVLILPLEKPRKCIIVDDVLTTGGTLYDTIKACKAAYIEVLGAFVLVDRRNPEIDDMFTHLMDVPVYSLHKMDTNGIII